MSKCKLTESAWTSPVNKANLFQSSGKEECGQFGGCRAPDLCSTRLLILLGETLDISSEASNSSQSPEEGHQVADEGCRG